MIKEKDLFKKIVEEICRKTRTEIPIVVSYKLKYYSAWCSYKEEFSRWRISYHPERISLITYKQLLHIVAHEIGHIRASSGDRKRREYKAELFALKTVKKYYPKYFSVSFTKAMIKNPVNEKYYRELFKKALKDFKNWNENKK